MLFVDSMPAWWASNANMQKAQKSQGNKMRASCCPVYATR